jgi:hypothetical protein
MRQLVSQNQAKQWPENLFRKLSSWQEFLPYSTNALLSFCS